MSLRAGRRTGDGHLSWISHHLRITRLSRIDRVPFPDKGKHVARRGRKATDQRWSLIAGLPKIQYPKGQRSVS